MPADADALSLTSETTRERLLEALRLELLGPAEPQEVLQQSPNTRYLVGMLAPSGTPLDPVEDESFEAVEEEEGGDGQIPRAASLDPSAIGISFAVDGTAVSVDLTASWGEYSK